MLLLHTETAGGNVPEKQRNERKEGRKEKGKDREGRGGRGGTEKILQQQLCGTRLKSQLMETKSRIMRLKASLSSTVRSCHKNPHRTELNPE